jgi:hypothetical protein
MTTTPRSIKFFGGALTTGGVNQTLFTVPTDRTALWKTCFLWNKHGAAQEVIVQVRPLVGSIYPIHRATYAAGTGTRLDLGIVLTPGDAMVAQAAVGGTFTVHASGTLLVGVAELATTLPTRWVLYDQYDEELDVTDVDVDAGSQ